MPLCLYCDELAESREHILASGIGGWLIDDHLICDTHNNDAGKFADDPLAAQFAYAVHTLDVLKGDSTRGTTWHNLEATRDGLRLNILPDRTTRTRTKFEYDEHGHPTRIVGTDERTIRKVHRQLQRLKNPPTLRSSERYIRDDILSVNIQTGGPSVRGVLKAAFHLAASRSDDRVAARRVAADIGKLILSETESIDIVRYAPYSTGGRQRGHEFHEITVWPEGTAQLLALVNLFNVVHFMVRLDGLTRNGALRFWQDTRTGRHSVEAAQPLALSWADCSSEVTMEFTDELDWRIDQVLTIGRCKAEVARLMDNEKQGTPNYEGLSDDERRQVLFRGFRKFKLEGTITSRTANALTHFSTTRLLEEAPNATWLPSREER